MGWRTVRIGAALLVGFVACGGKVEGGSTDQPSTGGKAAGGVGGKPIGSGGAGVGGKSYGGTGGASYGGTGAAGTGAVGNGGNVGGWAGVPPTEILGDSCESDAACDSGNGAVCLAPLHVGGGAPHGMCTFDCKNDPSFCGKAVPGSTCRAIADSMYCVLGCQPGPDTLTSFDPNKCRGRAELACAELENGSYGCLPNCNGDFDCPNGTVCNPKTGLCQVGAVGGAAIGATCTSDDACRGRCVTEQTPPFCTERCTIGALPACGWGGPGTGAAQAACLLASPTASSVGVGDLGYCLALCNSSADCANGASCTGLGSSDAQAFYGKKGYCDS